MKTIADAIYKSIQLIFKQRPNINIDIDYNKYWESKRGTKAKLSEFQKNRRDKILTLLSKGDTILEIGAGDGAGLNYINKDQQFKIFASDISKRSKNQIKNQGFKFINGINLNNPQTFNKIPHTDRILVLEVLEHIANPEYIINDLINHTNKGIIFSIPNTGFISHRLRLLFGKFPIQRRQHPGEHLRFRTLSDLKRWLNEISNLYDRKFKIKIITYEGIPRLNKIWKSLFSMGIIVQISKLNTYELKINSNQITKI